MKKKLIALAILCASACSTSTIQYTPPTEKPPALWQDNGQTLANQFVRGSPKVTLGKLKAGAFFLEYEKTPNRTGIITKEFEFPSYFGSKILKVPAGTSAYARQFSLFSQSHRNHSPVGPKINENKENDPIEWCIPFKDNVYCIFWESSESANMIDMHGHHPLKASGSWSTRGANLPVPEIKEQSVTFTTPLLYKTRIQKITKSHVYVRTYNFNPLNNDRVKVKGVNHNLPWNEKGETTLSVFDGEITFKRTDEKNFLQVELTKPIPKNYSPAKGIGEHGHKSIP